MVSSVNIFHINKSFKQPYYRQCHVDFSALGLAFFTINNFLRSLVKVTNIECVLRNLAKEKSKFERISYNNRFP